MAAAQLAARQPLQTIGELHQAIPATCQFVPPNPQQHVSYDDVPFLVVAQDQKKLKSEDVVFMRKIDPVLGDVHSVLMVCDGHQGAGAASHCMEHLPGLLGQLLPQHLPDWSSDSEVEAYAEKVRRAISTAAVLLDNDWGNLNDSSGTTLTLAVLSGWLLTVANTGDSNAIIDCGDDVKEITFSHRIQVNKQEQQRLRQAGAQLAPLGFHLQGPAKPNEMGVGPLRMWPGGLCVSRSIGDLDAGPLIVPLPHVRQVLLNRHRALRLIMASDGLWDLVSFSKAAKSVRHKLPAAAVDALMQMVVRDKRMSDDVSIVIADVLPPPSPGVTPPQFPAAALKAGGPGISSSTTRSSSSSGGGGGLFRCCQAPSVLDDLQPPAAAQPSPAAAPAVGGQPQRRSLDLRATLAGGLGRISGRPAVERRLGPPAKPWAGLQWLADVDCYEVYPVHKSQLARASLIAKDRPRSPPKRPMGDFTVHGGQAHRFQQDSSWHTGNSEHGSSNLPLFLSQQQVEQLQADGPAAAACMIIGGSGHGGSFFANGAAAAAAAVAAAETGPSSLYAGQQQQQQWEQQQHVIGSSSLYADGQQQQQQQQPAAAVPLVMSSSRSVVRLDEAAAAAAAAAEGSGGGRPPLAGNGSRTSEVATAAAAAASHPSRPIMPRSASAEYELEGSHGVYVADDSGQGLGAVGRVVKTPGDLGHYGSAPPAVAAGGCARTGGLTAAVAADESYEAFAVRQQQQQQQPLTQHGVSLVGGNGI